MSLHIHNMSPHIHTHSDIFPQPSQHATTYSQNATTHLHTFIAHSHKYYDTFKKSPHNLSCNSQTTVTNTHIHNTLTNLTKTHFTHSQHVCGTASSLVKHVKQIHTRHHKFKHSCHTCAKLQPQISQQVDELPWRIHDIVHKFTVTAITHSPAFPTHVHTSPQVSKCHRAFKH